MSAVLVQHRLPREKRRRKELKNACGRDVKRSMSLPGLGESSSPLVARAQQGYGTPAHRLASHVAALTRSNPTPKESDVTQYCKTNGLDAAEIAEALWPHLRDRDPAKGRGRVPPRRSSLPPLPGRQHGGDQSHSRRSSMRRVKTFDDLPQMAEEEQLTGWSSLDQEDITQGGDPVFNIGLGSRFDPASVPVGGLPSLPGKPGKGGRQGGGERARRSSALESLKLERLQEEGNRTRGSYFNANLGGARSRKCSMGREQLVGRT